MIHVFEHLAQRFAEILTKGDVMELFKMLERRYGTVSKVCEMVGIERRTFYHWQYAKQINSGTKAKVLRVALGKYPIDTLEFLARKSRDRTKELLEILIEFLRRGIVEEEDPKKAEELARRAEEIIGEFSVPVTEYLRHEIANLIEDSLSRGFRIEISLHTGVQQLIIAPPRTPRDQERPAFTRVEALVSTGTVSVPHVVLEAHVPKSLERWE